MQSVPSTTKVVSSNLAQVRFTQYNNIAAGWWFSPGTPVSSTNKTDSHYITEKLLKVALNTIKPKTKIYLLKPQNISQSILYLIKFFTI